MANQEKYAQQMQDAGVCDARGAALCATVKELPDGSFGMVLLGVKGNDLLIYDTNMKSEPLKLMHTIPLKGVTDFSTTSLMGEILKGTRSALRQMDLPIRSRTAAVKRSLTCFSRKSTNNIKGCAGKVGAALAFCVLFLI